MINGVLHAAALVFTPRCLALFNPGVAQAGPCRRPLQPAPCRAFVCMPLGPCTLTAHAVAGCQKLTLPDAHIHIHSKNKRSVCRSINPLHLCQPEPALNQLSVHVYIQTQAMLERLEQGTLKLGPLDLLKCIADPRKPTSPANNSSLQAPGRGERAFSC